MSRTVKYIFSILIIGAVALWLLTVYRSCERKKQIDNTDITTNTGTGDDNTMDTDSEGNDDLYVDEDSEDSNTSDTDSDTDTSSDLSDDTEDNGNSGADTDTGSDNESGGVFADGEADIDGEYLVVAGAFVLKENAEKHIRDLKNKGFEAERRVFLGSDYHSVIIGNFETEGAARAVANKLGKGNYVHKKRYLKKR